MTERGAASENEMVLAFLKAEIDSRRFKEFLQQQLERLHYSRSTLIDIADLANAAQNQARTDLLTSSRGYQDGKMLFVGFPDDVEWRRVEMDPTEIGMLKYAKYPLLVDLSKGNRRVRDGAENLDSFDDREGFKSTVRSIAERVKRGENFAELIVVQGEGPDLVIVEGHSRATAYVLAQRLSPVEVLIGRSPRMQDWAFY